MSEQTTSPPQPEETPKAPPQRIHPTNPIPKSAYILHVILGGLCAAILSTGSVVLAVQIVQKGLAEVTWLGVIGGVIAAMVVLEATQPHRRRR